MHQPKAEQSLRFVSDELRSDFEEVAARVDDAGLAHEAPTPLALSFRPTIAMQRINENTQILKGEIPRATA